MESGPYFDFYLNTSTRKLDLDATGKNVCEGPVRKYLSTQRALNGKISLATRYRNFLSSQRELADQTRNLG